MTDLQASALAVAAFVERVRKIDAEYRAGKIRVHVPAEWLEHERPLDEIVAAFLPASHRALEAASHGLFFSLPVAFDPAESVGPYLATLDADPSGARYRFLDLGAQIATQPFGENDPDLVAAVLLSPAHIASRYAHCEYQTVLSLGLKARLDAIAPAGTPRHFVVNTGAETVENGIKAVLLNRVRTTDLPDHSLFIISFDAAFHGRTLGCLAVTQRKKARAGFPTFDWPHVPFPFDDPSSPHETARREERSLRQIWQLLVTGRSATPSRDKEGFLRDMELVEQLSRTPPGELRDRIERDRAAIPQEVRRTAHRAAAVLVEPIQGEGGVRMARPVFFRRLRLLTALYDVPLLFDEVQTGGGLTGAFWAHELFELPLPPDAVMWAKKAQNGILFVSEELASFFQEEKKFNTTWEGDSVGMIRLLATLDKLDLGQVRRTGQLARAALEDLAREHPEIISHLRGAGCMMGFDVARPDLRDALRDRAFRRGLILLPAGERTLRFYPRFDMHPTAIEEAVSLLGRAIEDVLHGRAAEGQPGGPERRSGAFDVPRARVQVVPLNGGAFETLHEQIMEVEVARYGSIAQYPEEVLRSGRRPLLQYPASALDASMAAAGSVGVALRDTASGSIIAYALGSPLENYDEVGVGSDPHHGESNTFYLQATAVVPSVKNQAEIEAALLDELCQRVRAGGYEYLSGLIEARLVTTGPDWIRGATTLRVIPDYLGSGVAFAYFQATLSDRPPS
jgi:4-aminobutyrate aminotransferase/(S)-3-amino-2-methylpropionate transaminase